MIDTSHPQLFATFASSHTRVSFGIPSFSTMKSTCLFTRGVAIRGASAPAAERFRRSQCLSRAVTVCLGGSPAFSTVVPESPNTFETHMSQCSVCSNNTKFTASVFHKFSKCLQLMFDVIEFIKIQVSSRDDVVLKKA